MKAVVYHGVGHIQVDDVPMPQIQEQTDAIVRVTTAAICGTDLHFIRGTMPGMEPGRIVGHEGVGVVEEVGSEVGNLKPGDRVIISAVIGCGSCPYCRRGWYSQCDNINPYGPRSGSASFGSPKAQGPFDGLQAEYARVPFARTNLFRIPDEVSDDQAIPLSDIYPTAYFGATIAGVTDGNVVAVWGSGPVGQFSVLSAYQKGAGRVIVIDGHQDRLDRARARGAETINFNEVDPVQAIMDMTNGVGVDCAIDAVGIDSESAKHGPAAHGAPAPADQAAPPVQWKPGDAPAQAQLWAVDSLAKGGTLGIVGVYPSTHTTFSIGTVMARNLSVRAGTCNHPRYIPRLLSAVETGLVDPSTVLTEHAPLTDALAAYHEFDLRRPGWLKVALHPEPGGE